MTVTSPRMASADPLESEHPSFPEPVLQDRLLHVLTACGSKTTTCRQEGRNDILIDQDRKYGNLSQVGFKHFLYLLVWYAALQPKLLN